MKDPNCFICYWRVFVTLAFVIKRFNFISNSLANWSFIVVIHFRPSLSREKEFGDLPLEADRVRVFNEFLVALEESCGHHHKPRKPKKAKQVTENRKRNNDVKIEVLF